MKNRFIVWSKLLIFSTLIVSFAFSNALFATEYRRIGQSHRSLAMGGTGISSANDSYALFYNPAVLANLKGSWWDMLAIGLEYTPDAKALYSDLRGGIKLETQAEKQEFLGKYIGADVHARGFLSSNAILPLGKYGATLGGNYMFEMTIDIHPRNPVSPVINVLEQLDRVRQVGISIPLSKLGDIVLGVTFKDVNREKLEFSYGINDVINNTDFPTMDDAEHGSGMGYDFGVLWRLPWASRPSLAFVVQNVNGINLGAAGRIEQEVSAGASIAPEIGPFRMILAVDAKDLTFKQGSEDDKSLKRRVHYGGELSFGKLDDDLYLFSVRAGRNQSYYTYGFELALGHYATVGLTQYSEEIGEYAGQNESSRKMLYLSFGW